MPGSGCSMVGDNNKNKPSPGYAGVSLSLAKTELNARGLYRTGSLRLNPKYLFFIFFNFFLEKNLKNGKCLG